MSESFFSNAKSKSERIYLSLFWFLLFIFLVVFDQLTKYLAFAFVDPSPSQQLFDIALFKNYNFAFSVVLSQSVMYAVYFSVIALAVIHVYRTWQRMSTALKYAWVIILAGAVSNVVERITFGYVKDFIKVNTGFFNLADVYILAGVVLVFIFSSSRFNSSSESVK